MIPFDHPDRLSVGEFRIPLADELFALRNHFREVWSKDPYGPVIRPRCQHSHARGRCTSTSLS